MQLTTSMFLLGPFEIGTAHSDGHTLCFETENGGEDL
jgi:hypothetical protein